MLARHMVISVSEINKYVRLALNHDPLLAGVFVRGEVSNFARHKSGHCFFRLSDGECAINAVMFKPYAVDLEFEPKNGQVCVAFGRVTLFEKMGAYQIIVENLTLHGEGKKKSAFDALFASMSKDGLFDDAKKRTIPKNPSCVAVITSPTGAAIADIVTTIRHKNPCVKIVLAPANVQGEHAPEDLLRALGQVNAWGGADVLIIGRGGGATEDLEAFNDETLCRAIAISKTPTISAVGHESDFTICDFVADHRASTPTAAADAAVADHNIMFSRLEDCLFGLQGAFMRITNKCMERVTKAHDALVDRAMHVAAQNQNKIRTTAARLKGLSPIDSLARGYVLALRNDNIIARASELTPSEDITLRFLDGEAKVNVKEVDVTNAQKNI